MLFIVQGIESRCGGTAVYEDTQLPLRCGCRLDFWIRAPVLLLVWKGLAGLLTDWCTSCRLSLPWTCWYHMIILLKKDLDTVNRLLHHTAWQCSSPMPVEQTHCYLFHDARSNELQPCPWCRTSSLAPQRCSVLAWTFVGTNMIFLPACCWGAFDFYICCYVKSASFNSEIAITAAAEVGPALPWWNFLWFRNCWYLASLAAIVHLGGTVSLRCNSN